MLEISISLVIVACIAGYLVNKFLDQRSLELERKHQLNIKSSEEELSASITELIKPFDARINDTWSTISAVKQELNTIKLQIGIKGTR